MHRQLEGETGAARPGGTVVDVTGKTLLTAVEVDGGDALASLEKRDRDVQGSGGFPRAALLVAEHDDMRRARLALASLHKHKRDLNTPNEYLRDARVCGQVKCVTGCANRDAFFLIMNRTPASRLLSAPHSSRHARARRRSVTS